MATGSTISFKLRDAPEGNILTVSFKLRDAQIALIHFCPGTKPPLVAAVVKTTDNSHSITHTPECISISRTPSQCHIVIEHNTFHLISFHVVRQT